MLIIPSCSVIQPQ